MTNQDFDKLLDSVRQEEVPAETVAEACARVRTRLESDVATSGGACAPYRSQFEAYRAGTLGDARRMLLEDHLHACVMCRNEYHGESKAKVISMTERRPAIIRVGLPWALAAAAVVVAVFTLPPVLDRTFAPSGARATVASVDGSLYRVSGQGQEALAAGAAIAENDQIRTAKGSRAVLRLTDGSRVEVGERSELKLTERYSGKTIHLERGAVVVEAAKQRRGSLEVATADCLVSVKGTIFGVARGTKGSRVSVVEGEVKVDQDSATRLLHKGDQTATHPSMSETSVADDVRWSEHSAKYIELLGELSAIQRKLEAIPGPGLRYKSKLAALVPENTVMFAAIPNIGQTLADATKIFEERVSENAVLREWWNEKDAVKLRTTVDQLRAFSEYLGDEIVLAVPATGGKLGDPVIIAEQRRPGLQEFLNSQMAQMGGGNALPPMKILLHGNIVAAGGRPEEMSALTARIDSGAAGGAGFLGTAFWKRISQSYTSGAGWLFAADMEQIISKHVSESKNVNSATGASREVSIAGLDNVRFLVVERKENLGRTENRASLSFDGSRKGVMSWLAAPGPMGSLEFVTPDASFAGSFVVKNPGTLLDEILGMAGSQADFASAIEKFQQETGINLHEDIARSLGGEITIAVDGPLLPLPSWKLAVEVYNPTRLQWAIEQLAATAQREMTAQSKGKVEVTKEQVNGLTYYTLSTPLGMDINYVFTDGYLLAGSSRSLLTQAMQTRSSGITLTRSAKFRAQMPQDGYVNFSGVIYYNVGAVLGPMVDQLKSGGMLPAEMQKSADLLTANREPTLIYAYGEPDQIVVASRGSFFGLGLDTLVGLNGPGARMFPQLMGPVLSQRRSPRPAGSKPRPQIQGASPAAQPRQ
ncbi:MAG TPA: FecR domain-containing protein [Bryobacteraceae bacterium]|nr:FecR domain-containing protein [Bryobacteraceae bacterium]